MITVWETIPNPFYMRPRKTVLIMKKIVNEFGKIKY